MNLLKQLLLERMYAPVHVNKDNNLYVIANLVQKQFGIPNVEGVYICLLSQFIFAIEATTGIPRQELVNQFKKSNNNSLRGTWSGHTPANLIDAFSKIEFTKNNKKLKLDIGFDVYKNIDEALIEIKNGLPVVMILNSNSRLLSSSSNNYNDSDNYDIGQKTVTDADLKRDSKLKNTDKSYYHSLLIIGYDAKDDLLICRESRDSYEYKGYFKLARAPLQKYPKSAFLCAFVVNSVKEV